MLNDREKEIRERVAGEMEALAFLGLGNDDIPYLLDTVSRLRDDAVRLRRLLKRATATCSPGVADAIYAELERCDAVD